MDQSLTETERAELRAYRAKAKRNAAARARRTPGGDYVAMNTRQAAHAPLYAEAGVVSLADLDYVAKVHARVMDEAVIRLVETEGYSWAMVGAELGVTRQAAAQRFGHLVKSRRARGAQPANMR